MRIKLQTSKPIQIMQSQKACILIINNEIVLNMCKSKYVTWNFKKDKRHKKQEALKTKDVCYVSLKNIVSLPIMRYYRTSVILSKNKAFIKSSLWIMRLKETTSPKYKDEREDRMWIVTNKTGSHYP